MEGPLLEIDLLTDHEPGKIPGGETPPSTAGGTPAATDARFMERTRLSTNPVGVDDFAGILPRVGPLRGPTLGFGTESRWDSGWIPSGPHPGPLPRAGEGENVPWIPKGWAWGWREWRVMACAARADQIAAGDTRLPLLRERVGVRGSRRSSWKGCRHGHSSRSAGNRAPQRPTA